MVGSVWCQNQVGGTDESLYQRQHQVVWAFKDFSKHTIFDSPVRMLCMAKCKQTRDDEQAVSSVKLGPFRSKYQEIRLETMAVPMEPLAS